VCGARNNGEWEESQNSKDKSKPLAKESRFKNQQEKFAKEITPWRHKEQELAQVSTVWVYSCILASLRLANTFQGSDASDEGESGQPVNSRRRRRLSTKGAASNAQKTQATKETAPLRRKSNESVIVISV